MTYRIFKNSLLACLFSLALHYTSFAKLDKQARVDLNLASQEEEDALGENELPAELVFGALLNQINRVNVIAAPHAFHFQLIKNKLTQYLKNNPFNRYVLLEEVEADLAQIAHFYMQAQTLLQEIERTGDERSIDHHQSLLKGIQVLFLYRYLNYDIFKYKLAINAYNNNRFNTIPLKKALYQELESMIQRQRENLENMETIVHYLKEEEGVEEEQIDAMQKTIDESFRLYIKSCQMSKKSLKRTILLNEQDLNIRQNTRQLSALPISQGFENPIEINPAVAEFPPLAPAVIGAFNQILHGNPHHAEQPYASLKKAVAIGLLVGTVVVRYFPERLAKKIWASLFVNTPKEESPKAKKDPLMGPDPHKTALPKQHQKNKPISTIESPLSPYIYRTVLEGPNRPNSYSVILEKDCSDGESCGECDDCPNCPSIP